MDKDLTLKFKVTDEGTVVLDKISKSIQKVSDDTEKMSKTMQVVSVAAFISIAKTGLEAANRVYDFSRSIASAGNDIQRMSRLFNMSTDELQKWSYVTKMADVDIEGFGQGFKFLTRSMGEALQGSGDAARAFSLLGINLKDTTGKTKDQQAVMMEVVGALEKFSDGVNRDALMLAIFGRGWMSFKPLINEGTKAIAENKAEAERLNTILGKDTIRALSESESAFKRWEMTWKVAKTETFSPMITIFTSILERILALRTAFKEGGFKGVIEDIQAAQEEQRVNVLAPAKWTKEWVAGYKPPTKPEAPAARDFEKYYKDQKDYYESLAKMAEIIERSAYPQFGAFWEELKGMDIDVIKLNKDMDAWFSNVQENLKEFHYEAPIEGPWTEMGLSQAEFEYYQKTGKEATKARSEWAEAYSEISEMDKVWANFTENFASAWNFNVSGILKGTEKIGDAFKNMAEGMLDTFINAIMKMITTYALFGNLKGTYTSGVGILGLLGSAVGLQEGGQFWVNRPTPLLVGEGGQREFVSVTPEDKMGKGGGDTYISINNYNQVNDPNTFVRLYGPVVKSLSQQSVAEARRFSKMK
jgi:hypothetical protein